MKLSNPKKPTTPYLTFEMHCILSMDCVSLNESTSYLSLCVSMNSFCTWTSASPETKCVISAKDRGSNPSLSFGWAWVLTHRFKPQCELCSFRPTELHIWLSGNFSSDINTANFVYAFSPSSCLSCILESLRSQGNKSITPSQGRKWSEAAGLEDAAFCSHAISSLLWAGQTGRSRTASPDTVPAHSSSKHSLPLPGPLSSQESLLESTPEGVCPEGNST